MTALRLAPCLFLLALAACDTSDAPAPAVGASSAAGTSVGRIEMLTFTKLQGRAEAMPCAPGSISPLASAARTKAELVAEGGADVRLICVGDSLRQTATVTGTRAARDGAEARDDVILDAMVAAGVDMYVPSYGDFAGGVLGLLDRCAARGLPVVLTNVDVDGRDDVLPYLIFENNGTRIAALGAIPTDSPKGKRDVDEPEVKVAKPVRRLQSVSETLLAQDLADMIVVFSAMPEKVNQRLADVPSVHFIIGTTDHGMASGRIVHRHETWLMNQEFNGLELGHTTVKVVDGSYNFADLSGLYYLPEQNEREAAAMKQYEVEFGTTDLNVLARGLMPGRERDFVDKFSLLEANRQWLIDYADYAKSYVAHRVEPFVRDADTDPVNQTLAGQAAAIKAAVERLAAEPSDVDPFSHISKAETCQECHADQYAHWVGTTHATGYERLVEVGRENDTACLVCHAAGYSNVGGFTDPRVGAPFGSFTCWNCHATQSYHAELLRGATDPAFIGFTTRAQIEQSCENCHSDQRSPGFDLESAMARVTCPPMRQDDPTLSLVRGKVLKAIERQREAGTEEPRDRYREGRALIGLGRTDEGLTALHEFLDALDPSVDGYLQQHIEVALFLDQLGRSGAALELISDLLARFQGDGALHQVYVTLLLDATDETQRNPARAATHLSMVAPIDEGHRFEAEEFDVRVLQVRALFESGRKQEGYELLQGLNASFARNERIQELMERYLGAPR